MAHKYHLIEFKRNSTEVVATTTDEDELNKLVEDWSNGNPILVIVVDENQEIEIKEV